MHASPSCAVDKTMTQPNLIQAPAPIAQPQSAFCKAFMTKRVAAVTASLWLSACSSLHSSYETPSTQIPAQWSNATQTTPATESANTDQENQIVRRTTLADAWWTHFDDAHLNQLIDVALQNNPDLVTAAWNIQIARLNAGLANDNATPSLGASINTSANRNLDNGSTNRSYSVGLNLSYEVDLWGKIASQRDAAQWRLDASRYDLQTTAITLVANVATLYWQLALQNDQIAYAKESLAYAMRTQELVQAQYNAGAVSGLEIQEARRAIASQQSILAGYEQARKATLNALAVLLNEPPSTSAIAALLPQQPQTLPSATVPNVPEGLPAQILQRRPDLQAAEMRLRATLADQDATAASYYPSFNLTGSLGSSSTSLGNILSNPLGTLAANIAFPFLNYNQMRFNNAIARANYESAAVNFQKTFYTALQEVEDALSTRQQLQEQGQWLAVQLDAAQRVEKLNETRYRAGSIALKTWLDAQESRRTAALSVSSNQFNQLVNQLSLYKALGGDTVFEVPAIAVDN